MIKILQISASGDRSGGSTYLLELAKGLDKSKFHLTVACPEGPLAESLKNQGVPIVILRMQSIGFFSSLIMLRRLLKKEGFSLVQSHGLRPNVLARLAIMDLEIPLISTYHVSPSYLDVAGWKKRLYALIDHWSRPWSSLCLFVSQTLRQQISPSENVPWIVIPNGVDTSELDPARYHSSAIKLELGLSRDKVLAVVGRLSAEKGQRFLLEALGHLTHAGLKPKAIFVGEGPLKNALQEQSQRLGLNGQCLFLGSRNDVPDILWVADTVVVPSLIEGMPHTVMEAMALEKCVLGSAVGGMLELIEDKTNGFLFEPGNSKILAQKLEYLLNNPDQCLKAGKNARKTIKNQYNLEKWMNSLHTLYGQLAKKGRN